MTGKAVRTCPHCNSVMNKESWDQVISVYFKAKKINNRLAADNLNRHDPLFAVSFIEDRPFTCAVSDIDIDNIDLNID